FTSEYAKYWYGACIFGWVPGLLVLRGRPRVLVVAAVASFAFLFAYSTAFLMLQPNWWLPLPIYIEQCIWPLFTTAGIAGYWGVLRQLGLSGRYLIERGALSEGLRLLAERAAGLGARSSRHLWLSATGALALLTVTPGTGIWAAVNNRQLAIAWELPWPDETGARSVGYGRAYFVADAKWQ